MTNECRECNRLRNEMLFLMETLSEVRRGVKEVGIILSDIATGNGIISQQQRDKIKDCQEQLEKL